MEKFSVLMSLYIKEKAKHLDECLSSLYNQTALANEIVIVLDGEITSELNWVIKKWEGRLSLVIIPLPHNVGLGNALNIGLKHCSNRLVARMDTDDICMPSRFERQLAEFDYNNQLVIVGSNITEYDESMGEIIGERIVPHDYLSIRQYAAYRNPFNHMTVMFDKNKIIDVGGYQHHHFMEDYNLWLRCLSMNYSVLNIQDSLVNVRTGDNMIHRRRGLDYIGSELLLYKLKRKLGYVSFGKNVSIFLMRALPRLMPVSVLRSLYKKR